MKINYMKINYININQTNDLIGIGTDKGYIIKNLQNKILIQRNIGIINIIELYYRSNIVFIVGHKKNVLQIYNDNDKNFISYINIDIKIELLKIQNTNILIATINNIYLYDLHTLKLKKTFLINNLTIDLKENFLIYIKNNKLIELYNINTNTIHIKQNTIDNIQLVKISNELKYLAVVSENGCNIKIFNFHTHKLVREYYRGIRESKIKYMSFNNNDTVLFVYSDKNTLHIYKINEQNEYFFSYIYSKHRMNLDFNNILCKMDEDNLLYIINKENGLVSKYEYIKLD